MVTDVVGAVRTRDGKTIGYIGASILIERIGRRLSSISFTDMTGLPNYRSARFPAVYARLQTGDRTKIPRGGEIDFRYSKGTEWPS